MAEINYYNFVCKDFELTDFPDDSLGQCMVARPGLKIEPGDDMANHMTKLQKCIDDKMAQLPPDPQSPFLRTLKAPIRTLRECLQQPDNHVSRTLKSILQFRHQESIPDMIRLLHEQGVKCIFTVQYDPDLTRPSQYMLYAHVQEDAMEIPTHDQLCTLYNAFALPPPTEDLTDLMRALEAKKPAKHLLQNSAECFHPLADTVDGGQLMTSRTIWLIFYLAPNIINRISVDNVDYFEHVGALMKSFPVSQWRAYFLFVWMSHMKQFFEDTEVNQSKKMTASQEAWVQDASYQFYVMEQDHIVKCRPLVEAIAEQLRQTLHVMFQQCDWQDKTREEAKSKLNYMQFNIGWGPNIVRDQYPEIQSLRYYDEWIVAGWRRHYWDILKLNGQKVDKTRWRFLGLYNVNACYSREMNTVYIPPALFYTPFLFLNPEKMPENFAGIGSILAHEIYHGFDYDSRELNARGRIENWWDPRDDVHYRRTVKKLIALYSKPRAISSARKHNGRFTLSENMADFVALDLAYQGLVQWWKSQFMICPGTSEIHRFFYLFAMSQIQIYSESGVKRADKDLHALSMARVNLPLSCYPPFLDLYRIKPRDPMYTPASERPVFFQVPSKKRI